MSEMLKRLALIMYERNSGTLPPNAQAGKEPWRIYVSDIRAVLAAMREPTKKVAIAVSGREFCDASDELAAISYGAELWRAAIDEILKEE